LIVAIPHDGINHTHTLVVVETAATAHLLQLDPHLARLEYGVLVVSDAHHSLSGQIAL
jgi:hypothetical protein